jgi:CMP-N,N'-diacetyllegionaminic acid synthase
MKITAIIPARGGSKGIPGKNIKLLNNKPLIAYSIEQAQKSNYINEIVVTTDDEKIAEVAKEYYADVPYLRPKEISGDLATDYEFIKFHLDWCKQNDKIMPDLIVQLRPTYPLRKVEILDNCLEIMMNSFQAIPYYDSLRTIIPNEKTPYKMYTLSDNENFLLPLFDQVNGIKEPYNQPRQILPKTYLHNGYIDIIKVKSFIDLDSITGQKIYPYILSKEEIFDIDTYEDWEKVEKVIQKNL